MKQVSDIFEFICQIFLIFIQIIHIESRSLLPVPVGQAKTSFWPFLPALNTNKKAVHRYPILRRARPPCFKGPTVVGYGFLKFVEFLSIVRGKVFHARVFQVLFAISQGRNFTMNKFLFSMNFASSILEAEPPRF